MRIIFQGERGANSNIACRTVYPDAEAVPCATFEDCFAAIENGDVDLGMIPIENSIAGRVADIHHLLPYSRLQIIGEHFMPIRFDLMAPHGATLQTVRKVYSHIHALGQCRKIIRRHGWEALVGGDTAGSARMVAEAGDNTLAALAPPMAAETYGLSTLAESVEDEGHNTTRFVILARQAKVLAADADTTFITSFVFRVRNLPAALYKALGGFATNGVNMTKLESYQTGGQFFATLFYADIEGHPDQPAVARALEELNFFSAEFRSLGTYPASPARAEFAERARGDDDRLWPVTGDGRS